MNSLLKSILYSFVAGCLYAFTYPSFLGTGWFPLLFIALPIFIWRLEGTETLKQSLILVFFYNLGLNVTGFYWIPQTLREFGQLPYFISVILGALFSFILQPHWWIYGFWKKFRPGWNWYSERGVLISALILTLLERYFPQQFPIYAGSPWLHLAPYLGLAPILGVVGFSFMTYWVAMESITQLSMRKFRSQVWIFLVIFVGFNTLYPARNPTNTPKLAVRIVQANIGNFMKISGEQGDDVSLDVITKNYQKLSTVQNGFVPKLIVWPETAYPHPFYGQQSELSPIFGETMKSQNAEMLIGGYEQDTSKTIFDMIESIYNASLLLSDDKIKASYHKNILIPFGETLPFGPFNRKIVTMVPAVSLFARGEGTPLMETKDKFRFVTPICYEILESNYMRSLLNQYQGNHLIVNHTNDSWYGNTAEPYQHLFLSKWRALEFNLPIVRSTNTGITSVIYADASESKRLEIGTEGTLDVMVPTGSGQSTVYQDYGALPLYALFLFLILETWIRDRKNSLI